MCTIKEIREAIREDCSSQHDMDSAEIDVFYRLSRFLRIRNRFPSRDRKGRYFGSAQEDMEKSNARNSFYRVAAFFMP